MPAKRRVIKARALAKINLSLRLLGVRSDGYHELRTIFQSIALHDTLTLRVERGPFRLECDDRACPADRTNLVWRAAEQLWRASGRRGEPRDVAVHLTKRIPMRAGLGGGSSDAAAALRVMARLWRVDGARVRDVARLLGADVPYFLEGGTVLGLDRGDRLFPLIDVPSAWVSLVVPGFGVSTADAYEWWDRTRKRGRTPFAPPLAQGAQHDPCNDLQTPVATHYPQIARIVKSLERSGARHAAMSGSGSAVYGLFERRSDADRALRALAGLHCRTFRTRTVDRAAYQRLAGIAAHRISLSFAPRGFGHS